jgi:hypothetical protein
MEFQDADKNTFMSLRALCKSNNGFFKSSKQQAFLSKSYKVQFSFVRPGTFVETSDTLMKFFGVELREGEYTVEITGHHVWNDYGARAIIPAMIIFVLDDSGVVRQYKIGGNGNLRDGWAPNPKKCTLAWERPSDAVAPVFEEVKVADAPVSNFLGAVGQKVEVQATIKFVKDLGYSRFGQMIITTLVDAAGNSIIIWKDLGELGQQLSLKGTVKECGEFRGIKQTTLTRVKVL